MPKRFVEIEWDTPDYEGWLADGNIALALRSACPNTNFKVKGLQESFQDAVRNDPDMTEEQKDYWLSMSQPEPTCPEGHGKLIIDGDLLFCPVCKFTVSISVDPAKPGTDETVTRGL